jgi:hypothetical protein
VTPADRDGVASLEATITPGNAIAVGGAATAGACAPLDALTTDVPANEVGQTADLPSLAGRQAGHVLPAALALLPFPAALPALGAALVAALLTARTALLAVLAGAFAADAVAARAGGALRLRDAAAARAVLALAARLLAVHGRPATPLTALLTFGAAVFAVGAVLPRADLGAFAIATALVLAAAVTALAAGIGRGLEIPASLVGVAAADLALLAIVDAGSRRLVTAVADRLALDAGAAATDLRRLAPALAGDAVGAADLAGFRMAIALAPSAARVAVLARPARGDAGVAAADLPFGTGRDAPFALRIAHLARPAVDAPASAAPKTLRAVVDAAAEGADLARAALLDADAAAALLALGAGRVAGARDPVQPLAVGAFQALAPAADALGTGVDARALPALLAREVAEIGADAEPALLAVRASPPDASLGRADVALVFAVALAADVGAVLAGVAAGAACAAVADVAAVRAGGVDALTVVPADTAGFAGIDARTGRLVAVLAGGGTFGNAATAPQTADITDRTGFAGVFAGVRPLVAALTTGADI